MRFILKTILFPVILIMSIMIAFSKFIVSISGVILGLFAFLIVLGSLACFVQNDSTTGIQALIIAFLLSPYGLPKIAIWMIAFNFVVSIMYSQLFNLLCDKADDKYGGRLPVHVRFLLDEFANIGLIPKFEKLIATIRSREISASIILQAQSQLKAIYKDNADTIPNTSTNSDKPNGNDKNPETGDQTNIGFYTSLFVTAGLGLMVLLVIRKKQTLKNK